MGNKGGHGVKSNKGGHGVKGNDGNTTTGQKKRAAGRRSGLRRSTKMLLVVRNPSFPRETFGKFATPRRDSEERSI